MLPNIPFGKVSKINNSKAVTSRLYKTPNDTKVVLGMKKASKNKLSIERSNKRFLYEGLH